MKKHLSVLLIIMILLPVLTFSEGFHFSYRNGVEFGDTLADVKSKENGYPNSEDTNFLYYGNLQLSSIGNSAINYNFTDGKLTSILIDYNQNYGGREEIDSRLEEYNKINDGLARKYGDPSSSNEEDAIEYLTGAFFWYKNYYESNAHTEKNLVSFNQWVLNDTDYDVVIQHVLFEVDSSDWGAPHYCVHFLSYQNTDKDRNDSDLMNSIVDNDL